MNTLNNIISVKELKSKIDRDKSFQEALIRSEIRSQAFTMNTVYKPTTEISKYLKVACDMGFNISGNRIDFDLVKPSTEANDIMNEITEFKNDIINKVNSAIKGWLDTPKDNRLFIDIDLNKLLTKYKVDPQSSSLYSFHWLIVILKKLGYEVCIYNNIENNAGKPLSYRIALTWE